MSSGRGFFSSLFGSAREQSRDVYGAGANSALFFYILFAALAVAVPVAALIGITVFRIF